MRRWRGEFGRYRGFSHVVILSSRCAFNLAALQGGINLGYPRIGGFLLFPVHIGELWCQEELYTGFRDIISIVLEAMECRSDWWNNNSGTIPDQKLDMRDGFIRTIPKVLARSSLCAFWNLWPRYNGHRWNASWKRHVYWQYCKTFLVFWTDKSRIVFESA